LNAFVSPQFSAASIRSAASAKVGGLVMAFIVLRVISSAFNLLNFSPFLTVAIWGALILGVTALTLLLDSLGLVRR
jgi:ribose/xylose/arabinose/galactoside ABC-type transport system permease subunit